MADAEEVFSDVAKMFLLVLLLCLSLCYPGLHGRLYDIVASTRERKDLLFLALAFMLSLMLVSSLFTCWFLGLMLGLMVMLRSYM